MNVSEAVAARKSIRAFLDTPISNKVISEVLEKASRAPSGGNLQPWKIYVLNGSSHNRFRDMIREKLPKNPRGETMEYEIYPPKLKEPYRDYRYKVGEDMYALLNIPRDNKMARLGWFAKNYEFFGAPASLFCYVDRCMGKPQWSDLGMFLQTVMLLFQEEGIDTCAQEAWAVWHKSVTEYVGAPDELMLFCGMAIGYRDPEALVNQLHTERAPLEEFATFIEEDS